MKTAFIEHNDGNSSLILIFTGWSTDYRLFNGIHREGWDVAVVFDFSNLDFDSSFIGRYSTVYLYAWSLGVAVAAAAVNPGLITAAFAVNGTPYPRHDSFGIPASIYDATGDRLDPRNLAKFRRRMFSSSEEFRKHEEIMDENPDIESLRQQLKIVEKAAAETDPKSFRWHRAFIGKDDRIFPFTAQAAAWKNLLPSSDTVVVDAPHYIDIQKIIDITIPNLEEVRRHFSKALNSYDAEASAQRLTAERLKDILVERIKKADGGVCGKKNPKILEIGPGSGIFTKAYLNRISAESVDFVDIVDIPPFGLCNKEYYHKADAESFLRTTGGKWDIVLCSSAMQWFVNPAGFFANVGKVLNPGGIFAASTFLPGNLSELDCLRPAPLIYPSRSDIECWLRDYFGSFYTETKDIKLDFSSFRHLLMHLHQTGVSAAGKLKNASSVFSHSDIKSLTYRTLLFYAEKNTSAGS